MSGEIRDIDVLVAGAQKAGTTAIKNALAAHPRLDVHAQVEFPYFISEHLRRQPRDRVMKRYFPVEPDAGAIRVAKSVGVMYDDDAVDLAIGHNPAIRFAVVLRDPIGRAFSAFRYARRMGWEPESRFEVALTAPPDRLDDDPAIRRSCAYLRYSMFREHVERIESRVGRSRLHLELFDDLRSDPTVVVARLCTWIGVEDRRLEVPRSNEAGAARSQIVARMLRPRGQRSRVARVAQRAMPRRASDLALERARRLNVREVAREVPSDRARSTILEHCAADVAWLADRVGRDLSHWLRPRDA
jgi:hypothetical protein